MYCEGSYFSTAGCMPGEKWGSETHSYPNKEVDRPGATCLCGEWSQVEPVHKYNPRGAWYTKRNAYEKA